LSAEEVLFAICSKFRLQQLIPIDLFVTPQFADSDSFGDKHDIDRVIDDFVFMCMLVGNDFLSHCPHLEIDNGALSLMLNNYIDLLPEWGGYLTNKEKIHPERFEQFLYNLAVFEGEHFKKRGYEENESGWQLSSDNEEDEDDFYGVSIVYANESFLISLCSSLIFLFAEILWGGRHSRGCKAC
jgi:5'-3' exonuclease